MTFFLSNYHQHSLFCDGSDSPETLVRLARQAGFKALGFSSHAPLPYKNEALINFDWTMPLERLPHYSQTIDTLKTACQNSLEIYKGLECDYIDKRLNPLFWKNLYRTNKNITAFDYLIGSVHLLKSSESLCGYLPADYKPAVDKLISEYNGIWPFCRLYFDTVLEMIDTGGLNIVAHIELIDKLNSAGTFFDRNAKPYQDKLHECFALAAQKEIFIEINTSLIRQNNIPSFFSAIKSGHEMGVRFVLNSDCHTAGTMTLHYESIHQYLCRQHIPLWVLKNGQWQESV
jgi:histidinol-phosphatase (PHP family)